MSLATMHSHSLLAYHQGQTELFSKRKQAILQVLRTRGACSDREVMIALKFTDPNMVRPRITDMLHDGVLEELPNEVIDPISGMPVRQVRIRPDPRKPQAEFRFA